MSARDHLTSQPSREEQQKFKRAPLAMAGRASSKIRDDHLNRLAIVYVRQSSPQQVAENRESTARQYAFADQAVALGWPRERVLTIDEDLGKSARTTEGRSGFQRLVTEVTLNHVGMVLGLEMSRLARSSKDWHAFFEMCAVFGTLIADEDGVYDGNDPNDRLVLGLKGIISEMELHIMRNRLERGRENKAARGELFLHVPIGYFKLPSGELVQEPDEQARAVVQLVFDKFQELGAIWGVFRYLVRNKIQLGFRCLRGPNRGQFEWRPPQPQRIRAILHHPIYAGAYAYGIHRPAQKNPVTGRSEGGKWWLPPEECRVEGDQEVAGQSCARPSSSQERLRRGDSLHPQPLGGFERVCAGRPHPDRQQRR